MKCLAKPFKLSAGALAAALILSACGGGESTDKVAPTVVITDNVPGATATGPVTFTFTFSEEVKDFTAEDVAVSGGDKAATVTKSSATVYTLVVTPTANTTGTVSVSIPKDKFADMANNQNAAVAAVEQAYNTALATAPTTAPTAPTALAANVKSLYSDAYTSVAGFDIPNWGQGQMVSDVTVAANKVLKGDLFTYQGFQFDAINATTLGLTSLHIDVWSADATPIKAYIISAGQDSESVDIVPTAGAWKGVDIPLSSFTKINKGAIFQLKLDTAIQPITKVMYFDNIYFSNASTAVVSTTTAPTTAPTAPTALAANVKSLYSDAYTSVAGFDIPNWGQGQMVSDVTVAANKVLKGDLFTYQGFQFDAINATTLGLTSLHIDVWSADATPIKAYIISAGQDSESVDIVPTAGAWKGVDIPLSSFTKINKGAIFQLKLDTAIQPITKVMYFDNIYFTK